MKEENIWDILPDGIIILENCPSLGFKIIYNNI